ncbi:MAG: hypothetical protein IKR58_03560 [Lachnospiraceae bacterium]|nr:hypothetical protein [Lachnospiraceae bacterium]
MQEQDRRAVEGMARCGMDLDVLVSCFPSFPKDEVTDVYYSIQNKLRGFDDGMQLKVNCS